MSEPQPTYTTSGQYPVKVTYTNDAPDVREYLINLRRDLLRKVRDLDELIATMPRERPPT